MTASGEMIVHASCVAVDGKAVLIRGASGAGKSGLALELLGYGAKLVADDRTILRLSGTAALARAPAAIRGRIEARGVGILQADPLDDVPVVLVVDLDRAEPERFPPRRTEDLLGVEVSLVQNPNTPHAAAAILQYLKGGRPDDG